MGTFEGFLSANQRFCFQYFSLQPRWNNVSLIWKIPPNPTRQTNKQTNNLNSFQNTEQPATQTVNPEQEKSHVVLTAQAPAYEHREHSRHLELRSWSWKMEELKWKEFAEQSARGGGGALPDRERAALWVLSRPPTTLREGLPQVGNRGRKQWLVIIWDWKWCLSPWERLESLVIPGALGSRPSKVWPQLWGIAGLQ